MQQTRNQPLYAAKDRVPFNLTLVLALGIAGWGLAGLVGIFPPPANPEMILLLGVAVSVYTWLFTAREYLVYSDAVCVAYGKPRVKAIHFSNIAVVEMGSLATLDQLRIRPLKGRRQSIRVRDPEAFFDQLESALNAYRAAHPEENMDFQLTGRYPAQVVEGESVEMAEVEPDSAPTDDMAPPASEAQQPDAMEVEEELVEPESSTPAEEEAAPAEAGQATSNEERDDGENPPAQGQRSFY